MEGTLGLQQEMGAVSRDADELQDQQTEEKSDHEFKLCVSQHRTHHMEVSQKLISGDLN